VQIFFTGGPKDGTTQEWDGGELPPYLTFTGHVPGPAGFRHGDVYEKVLDNLGVDLGNGPQAEYRFAGDTAHGELTD
jgi:hypothetical protein